MEAGGGVSEIELVGGLRTLCDTLGKARGKALLNLDAGACRAGSEREKPASGMPSGHVNPGYKRATLFDGRFVKFTVNLAEWL